MEELRERERWWWGRKRKKNVSFGIGKKCGGVERGNYGDREKETEMKETKTERDEEY